MQVTTPTGRTCSVSRRWLPWRLAWEVRIIETGRERAVVRRELVRGRSESQQRVRSFVRELQEQYVDPGAPGFPVVVTRSPVSMGDDAADNTRVHRLDDGTAHPTVDTLLTAIAGRGPFISISGSATTWALRESTSGSGHGRPLAILVLDGRDRTVEVHPVADTSARIERGSRFHLEYLLTQSVERTIELIAADATGRRSLREDRLGMIGRDQP